MAIITKGTSNIPFSITGVDGVGINISVVFRSVAKMPIDLKSAGGCGAGFHEYGVDLGAEISPAKNPVPLKDLPPGLTEVYKG